VTAPYKAGEIEHLAKRVSGVREIKNEIATLSESSSDDELRTSIASRIYRDPTFWSYGIQVNPPIHILVDKGRVTLTGTVRSDADRREAELIARSVFGVLSVDNQLRAET
jgi:hyperosmotically inducible protein